MLQRFTAESSRELSALRKLKQAEASVDVPYPPLQIVNSAPFCLLSLLSAPFLNPLSSPSPPSLLSLLINSLKFHYILFHQWHIFFAFCFTP